MYPGTRHTPTAVYCLEVVSLSWFPLPNVVYVVITIVLSFIAGALHVRMENCVAPDAPPPLSEDKAAHSTAESLF